MVWGVVQINFNFENLFFLFVIHHFRKWNRYRQSPSLIATKHAIFLLKKKKFAFHLNRFKNRFRPLQTGSLVPLDSLLIDEANKRSFASNGLLGAEKSQKEKLYVCCPFSHNCKCWLNISRLLAECWPIASRIGVDVFIKNAKSKSSNLAFLGILMGKVPP